MKTDDLLGLVPLILVVGTIVWLVKRRAKPTGPELATPIHAPGAPTTNTPATTMTAGLIFERICWLVTAMAATYAAFGVLDMSARTDLSAPQYAAAAAGACAKVIVPYVFSRAVQGWRRSRA